VNDPVLRIDIGLATRTLGERLPDCDRDGCGREASHVVELVLEGVSHPGRSCGRHPNELAAGAGVVFRLAVDEKASA
jgi:hypothetical protein